MLLRKYTLESLALPEIYFDGNKNLKVARKALPFRVKAKPGIFFHVYLHYWAQLKLSKRSVNVSSRNSFPVNSQLLLIKSLKNVVSQIKLNDLSTTWSHYYTDIHYTKLEFEEKKQLVEKLIHKVKPKVVWDIAGNTGEFSKLALNLGASVILLDSDESAVELSFRDKHILLEEGQYFMRLVIDMLNPTSNHGWGGGERKSLTQRSRPDLVLALALTHHLSITNGIPLRKIAEFFSSLSEYLIVEHSSGSDSQVIILNQNKKLTEEQLSFEVFENSFLEFFDLLEAFPLKHGLRRLYLFRRRGDYGNG